jgi:hypothetical protein
MLTPRSRILWGVGLENPLDFAWAIDSFVPTRKPRAGSQRVAIAGAGYDTWVTGRDYHMAGVARYLEAATGTDPLGVASGWEAAAGVEEFLTWAGDGNQFTFVPDVVNAPDFTVPSCWLEDPFEPEPTPEEDGTLAQALRICNATVPFGQAMRGIMFEYAPGASLTDPVAATFTRATAATRRGLPGTLVSPVGASDASGVLRDRHYEGSLRTTLLEAARTQLVTDPENFGAWTAEETPVLTAGQADPFGGTAAYLVNDDDGAVLERIRQTVGFTADATKSISVFMRAGSSASSRFGIFDNTVATWRHQVNVTWTAGVPTLATNQGSGTLYPVEPYGGGWYRLSIGVVGVVAANTNFFYLMPTLGNAASETGTTYFFGANAWNAVFPSSYQGPSLTNKSADVGPTWSHLHRPQPVAFYYKGVWRSGAIDYTRLMNIGQFVAGVGQRVLMYGNAGGSLIFSHGDSFASVAQPAYGDVLELLGYADALGRAQIIKRVNGGAEVAGTLGAAQGFPASYTRPNFDLGSEGGADTSDKAVTRAKVMPFVFGGITRDTIAKALAA